MSGYVNGVLLSVLRTALVSLDGSEQVQSRIRADYIDHLPYVHVRGTVGGGTLIGPDLDRATQAPFQIDVYAAETRDGFAVMDDCVAALNTAWRRQTATADGFVSTLRSMSGPSPFPEPDRADDVARVFMTGLVTVKAA